jgi:uroporphyrinogen decarboxylase
MNFRENFKRTIHFKKPEWIPMVFYINPACWRHYQPDILNELIDSHPFLFHETYRQQLREPELSPIEQAGKPYIDGWGCVWLTTENGIHGTVVQHPLENWEAFDRFVPPDATVDSGRGPIDWRQVTEDFKTVKASDTFAIGALQHGHTFLTLADIRGYENLIFDMADDNSNLWKLIEIVERFNQQIVREYINAGAELMKYPEDLGMQVGPLISPSHFRKYIKPSYKCLMTLARDAGCSVHMHSDGDIRDLIDDMIECGVEVLNLQDTVNGIDWIRGILKGKICIDLDIDRQNITKYGTPDEIDKFILDEIKSLGSKQGGLMMLYDLYPGIPVENVQSLMNAMTKYSAYYS